MILCKKVDYFYILIKPHRNYFAKKIDRGGKDCCPYNTYDCNPDMKQDTIVKLYVCYKEVWSNSPKYLLKFSVSRFNASMGGVHSITFQWRFQQVVGLTWVVIMDITLQMFIGPMEGDMILSLKTMQHGSISIWAIANSPRITHFCKPSCILFWWQSCQDKINEMLYVENVKTLFNPLALNSL